ncbi:transposase (plasmid) [Streptomyces sp. FXJ1.172]|uniref:transposase n=1 Tax=Streptomyces sp. FXJ1.172 TaxID=710705 RepID=UPI0023DD4A8B|nr:transposase [Streptomyces sp. FXJ1.172]WEP00646.1 transposase [Streptomyces sp. FXJ1.172]
MPRDLQGCECLGHIQRRSKVTFWVKAIGWDERLSDKVNGKGMVGHAGAALLRRCADRTGLTGVLGQVLPRGSGAGWRERGQLVVMLAVAIVLGTRSLLDAEVLLAHQAALFGVPASDSTMRRALAAIDEKVLAKIAKARARVRRDVWSQVALRPGGFPWLSVVGKRLTGWIIIDIDATIIASASKKAGAAATFKRTFGFHPLAAWCANTQECLAMLLREGNAGANTVADHLRLLADVLRQIPDSSAAKILIRIDGAGATHDLLDHCPPPADSPPAPRREQEGANTHNPGAVEPGRSRSDTRRPCPAHNRARRKGRIDKPSADQKLRRIEVDITELCRRPFSYALAAERSPERG